MDISLFFLLILPLAAMPACFLMTRPALMLRFVAVVVCAGFGLAIVAIKSVSDLGRVVLAGDWLMLDALSAYHLMIMFLVFMASSLFALTYFRGDIASGKLTTVLARRYAILWLGSLFTMTLTLVSNNIGLMWVGMEATTLVTAFLVSLYAKAPAIEAMWKYLIICSVGIAFAFIGTLLVGMATPEASGSGASLLFWTSLHTHAPELQPMMLKVAFLFTLVGYGTKAGLAPTHTWLPDAHSQAPGPVSAMFSGFMLNAALYCIIRHSAIVNRALGSDVFTSRLFILFGLFSIVVAAAFIISQRDIKRLLAYHSVEHLGIITLGLGLGPAGCFAAMLHTFNHSLCKSLSFFAAGRLGQIHDSYDMRRIHGALHLSPLWGTALVGSLLALIGVAPSSIFISEFLLVKAALSGKAYLSLAVFLFGSGVVFVAALEHLIPMAWGKPTIKSRPRSTSMEILVVGIILALLLLPGLYLPHSFEQFIGHAASIAGGTQ